jgi:glutamate-1-semialdehyde 2,1-aminomutase
MSRRVASLLPFYEYDEARFFRSDDPPRRSPRSAGRLHAAVGAFQGALCEDARSTAAVAGSVSDLQFTDAYRVPFQYSRIVRQHLPLGSFLQSSGGVTVTDLDGNTSYDLTGSYGVNLFGTDFYKTCMERGHDRVRDLGLVLGSYHPVVADNVRRLKAISGLDGVSFHMSGTEAVMQAVRLARYHTGRSHLVRFCGAYHGWWGDVQPGVSSPLPRGHLYAEGYVRRSLAAADAMAFSTFWSSVAGAASTAVRLRTPPWWTAQARRFR